MVFGSDKEPKERQCCLCVCPFSQIMSSSSILKIPGGSRASKQASRQADRQAGRQASMQVSRQASREAGRHAGMQAGKH